MAQKWITIQPEIIVQTVKDKIGSWNLAGIHRWLLWNIKLGYLYCCAWLNWCSILMNVIIPRHSPMEFHQPSLRISISIIVCTSLLTQVYFRIMFTIYH